MVTMEWHHETRDFAEKVNYKQTTSLRSLDSCLSYFPLCFLGFTFKSLGALDKDIFRGMEL
jgi:hypothetical protein